MKRNIIKYLAVLFLGGALAIPVQAQKRTQRVDVLQGMYSENVMVSLVPLPLFFHGFRVDVDFRLKDNLWLQLAPQYNYYRKSGIDRIDGFCFDANLRYYVKGSSARGFYVGSGLAFDFNQVSEQKDIGFYKVNSPRFGSQLMVGYQLNLWRRAVLDFYIGAAYRYAFNSFEKDEYRQVMESLRIDPWEYQFGGVYMQAGVRIGLML